MAILNERQLKTNGLVNTSLNINCNNRKIDVHSGKNYYTII